MYSVGSDNCGEDGVSKLVSIVWQERQHSSGVHQRLWTRLFREMAEGVRKLSRAVLMGHSWQRLAFQPEVMDFRMQDGVKESKLPATGLSTSSSFVRMAGGHLHFQLV